MDIKKAKAVKFVDEKWGVAIFETDWKNNPCAPTAHLLERQTRKNGTTWVQMTPGWYVDTLLRDGIHEARNPEDPKEVGLYIDYGQDWFIPAGPYEKVQKVMQAYVELGAEFHDNVEEEIW